MTNLKESKITIAGAGLVGSLLALILKQKGMDVEVYERRHDIRLQKKSAGRSINLVVTSRGIHALKQVGLWEKVQSITVPVFGRMIHDKEGNLSYQPYGREGECNYSVSRLELNKFLLSAAEEKGVKFFFNSSLKEANLDTKTLFFEDGSQKKYEILFGTDGAGSELRKSLIKTKPEIIEQIIPFPADYKELTMPADLGGLFKMDYKALHIWPRGAEMLMALPNPSGDFTMTLYLPKEKFLELTNPEKVQKYFEEQFKDVIPHMPDYVDHFFDHPQGHLNTLKLSDWIYSSSVCLLGDAAHAIVPFFGQGMNCGFEDCSILIEQMEKSKSWEDSFTNFFKARKPNADAIADMAIENGREMSEKVGDKRFLLKKQIEHKIEEAFPQNYRSRYGMITYTLEPYSKALSLGRIQDKMLEGIMESCQTIDDFDISKAQSYIEKFLKNLHL